MDNLLCVETLFHSPHDILESKSSGKIMIPFYDKENSSGKDNGVYFSVRIHISRIATLYNYNYMYLINGIRGHYFMRVSIAT